jgi:hypothetical protein
MIRFAKWLLRLEFNIWRSLLWWIVRRKPGAGPHARTFTYTRELGPLIGVFILVSALELVVVHLLLPWETLRLVLDIVSLWGLLWMLGLLASMRVYLHVVDAEGLRVRHGFHADLRIPWDAITDVRTLRGRVQGKGDVVVEDDVLCVPVLKQTRVVVKLQERTSVGPAQVTEVRLYADDPKAFVAAARERIGSQALLTPNQR